MPNNYHLDPQKLIEEFNAGKTAEALACQYGCHKTTIYANLRRHGVNIEESLHKYIFKDEQWLREQFALYGTPSSVSEHTGIPRTSISRYAQKFGIRLPTFTRSCKNSLDENFFSIIDTEEKAYWLGFFMADANMYQRKNGTYQFSFGIQSTDGDMVYKFAKAIFFDETKIRERSNMRNGHMSFKTEIKIYNQEFCANLLRFGIVPRKSGKENFPAEYIPEDLKIHFIRGFFDGDGSILLYENYRPTYKAIQVCSMSKDMLDSIQEYFNMYNITFIESTQNTKNSTLYILKLNKAARICHFIHLVYDDAHIYLPRKYDTAMRILKIFE